jgi:hypothetical protein
MPFENGTVTFQACRLNKNIDDNILEDFIGNKAKSTDHVREEVEVGWVTSRHLLDTNINEESAYVAGYLHLVLRSAIRKIPASLLAAECRIEEIAMQQANDLKELTRKMKKEIKEDISDRLIDQMPPSLSGIPFVALNDGQTIYLGATSPSQLDSFFEEFRKTTDIEPYALTPEVICSEDFGIDPEALPRLNFSRKLNDEYACNGTIGQDFLTWLLFISEAEQGLVDVGEELGGEFAFGIDGPLLLVADGKGSLESLIRKGLPTQSAELQAALDVGKKLKSAKLIFGRGDDVWYFTIDSDSFAIKGLKLPQGEKLDKESEFQERMINIEVITDMLSVLFKRFVSTLQSPEQLENLKKRITRWLDERSQQFGD